MTEVLEEKKVGYQKSNNAFASVIDVEARSQKAYDEHKSFFTDPVHVEKVETVKDLLNDFFKVKKAIYVNCRANRGRPFTVIKVEQPDFPNHLPARLKNEMYRDPLKALDVEVVFSKNTNSYLYRVY